MKKIISILLFCLISVISFGQTYKFKTTSFSYKSLESYGWSKWSDWEKSEMLVVINTDKDVINIYSQSAQEYDIVEYLGEEKDGDGGKSIKYLCVNEDGARCHIRLRQQRDGQNQLYVDFSDFMFVYCIVPRN